VNAAALAAYGYRRDEFLAMTVPDLHPPDEAGRVPEAIARRPADLHRGTWRHRLKDGTVIDVAIASHRMPFTGRPAVLVLARDVTAERALETRLRHQALHDPLTGLANRELFQDRVDHALERSGRRGATHAVLFLDLDTFKAVNDTLGHVTGDRLLVEFAERLSENLRAGDTAARLGGDEFAVLLEDISEGEATGVATRFLEVFRRPVRVEGREVVLTASVGIAVTEPERTAEELLRNADLAMYEAKRRGRNRWTVFSTDLHAAARQRFEVEADLRAALERDELSLQYQPVVTLPEGRIIGIEALVRWRHPERGPLSPAEFIPVAEDSGLIHPLGRWVLHTACREFSRWTARYPAARHLSVNVSTRQLDDGFVTEVDAALAAADLEPGRLVLEITESLFIGDVAATVARLQRLKRLGVRLAMDDFGTGYSSLSYLGDLPLDILKIDKSFVDVVSEGPEKSAVARAVIRLARTFGLLVVAEGVEEAEQVESLVALGCTLAQGYWFSRPLDPADLEVRLAAEPSRPPVVRAGSFR
jgi:diguanylate cyclase (GGDEF)-like protein/PAS domain S-box-containing protein